MGLTEYERSVLTELLAGVAKQDLIQIAKTVSQKLIDIDSVTRAMEVILLHSQTVESVLHRKKISKQLLFNYLHYKEVPVQSHLSKDEIIQRLVNYWKNNPNNFQSKDQFIEDENKMQATWEEDKPSASHVYMTYSQEQQQQLQNQHTIPYNNYEHYYTNETSSLVPQCQDFANPNSSQVTHPTSNQIDVLSNININDLGLEFTKWFTERFNTCNSTSNYYFDANMFFKNASAEIKIVRQSGEENHFDVEQNVNISNTIVELQKSYNLYLNMNADSLKVNKNAYGNIIVGICGSLHSNCELIGIYEQLFQLFNDPLYTDPVTNKPVWKIQKTLLNFKFVNNYCELENVKQDQQSIEYVSQQAVQY